MSIRFIIFKKHGIWGSGSDWLDSGCPCVTFGLWLLVPWNARHPLMSMDLEWLVCAPQKKFNISRHWTEDTFALYMLMERRNFSSYHQHTGLVWVCAPVGQWSIPPSRSQWLNTSKSAWGSKHGMPSCLHDLFLYYRFLILGPCVFYDHALAWATLGWTLTLYFLYLLYLFAWLLLSCNTFGLLLPTRFSSSVPQVSSLQYVISTNYYLPVKSMASIQGNTVRQEILSKLPL